MITALALISRELRIESRRRGNYWARVAAGGVVTIAFALATVPTQWSAVSGINLFNQTSRLVLSLIWLIGPLLTSDCLSREKREGTLGLLFLTPLRPHDIVVAKSLVHGLRASSVVLAAVPVLALTLLFGGVSFLSILVMVMHYTGALCVALAAGLLASAWSRDWLRSVLLTAVLTIVFGSCYYGGMSWVSSRGTFSAFVLLLVLALIFLIAVWVLTALTIERTWQDGPLSKWSIWWNRTFCSPIFWKDLFRRSSQAALQQNPIRWLFERTATGRVAKWIWCGTAICAISAAIGSSLDGGVFRIFEIGLGLAMAFAGVSSFRRERQNGMLELLLVAPLAFEEILRGRIQALRKQFAPAVAIVVLPLFGFIFWTGSDLTGPALIPHCLLLLTSLAILPPLGLYCSLRLRQFISAWLLASLIGLFAPFYAAHLLIPAGDPSVIGMASLLQVAAGLFAIRHCRSGLRRQSLVLQVA